MLFRHLKTLSFRFYEHASSNMDESGTGVINMQAMNVGMDVDGALRIHSLITENIPQTIHPIESPAANARLLNNLA